MRLVDVVDRICGALARGRVCAVAGEAGEH
jgi:hypothetical protein